MQAKRISEYLDTDDSTSRLMPQVALLLELRKRLASTLPETLLRSCTIANYKQGVVVLLAGNNAVAAKLRLLTPRLLETLSERGLKVTGIKIQLQYEASFSMQDTEKKALKLPVAASAALTQLGRNLPDSSLKKAVQSLAKKAR
jgi:hypothetical protein